MRIGTAKTNITPPVGSWQAGFGFRDKPSEGIHQRLYSRAFAFDDGGDIAVACVNDLIGLSRPEILKIRERAAARRPGLKPENVLIACAHTHSGPTVSTYLRGQPKDFAYIDRLCDRIAEGIVEAVRAARPATCHWTETDVYGFNHNRRNAEQYVERRLAYLEFRGTDGGLLGGLVNFTAHPTMLQGYLISGDYVGAFEQNLESRLGGTFGALNGCHGDLNGWPRAKLDYALVEDHGRRLADEVLRSRFSLKPLAAAKVGVRSSLVPLTFGAPKPRAFYEAIERKGDEPVFVREWARDVLGKYSGDPLVADERGEVMALRLGDGVLIGLPGHAFAEIGGEMLKALGGGPIFIVNHANDYLGYFGTRRGHAEGGYELTFAYRFNSSFPDAMDADTTYRIRDAAIALAR